MSTFIVHENWKWEIKIPEALGGDMGESHYHFVKMMGNDYIFHIDVSYLDASDPDLTWTDRILTPNITLALGFIATNDFTASSITLQPPRHKNSDREYSLIPIVEVFEAKDSAGQQSFVFVCKDGSRYIDSPIAKTEDELVNYKLVYCIE